MSNKVIVHKDRVNVIQVNVGINLAGNIITSEIRSEPTVDSPLIATWVVSFVTDGTDGKLLLTMDDSVVADIAANSGFMDLKRVVAGQPYVIFDRPLEVSFRGTVTE